MVSTADRTDVDAVLEHRHGNGGDFWASADGRLAVGSPFSTLEALLSLHELRVGPRHEAVRGAVQLLLDAWREDGRYRLGPSGTLQPCHTANAARILCRFGRSGDGKVQRSLEQLLSVQHQDGGWRCSNAPLGRSPESDASNPGVTLFVLDLFRFCADDLPLRAQNRAIDAVLGHWQVRRPMGPCNFGIGTLFMQTEYPFFRYNLFYYVYVLSFFKRARRHRCFGEALKLLENKLDSRRRMIIERPNRKMAKLNLCAKGQPSAAATRRFREIEQNLAS